MYKVEINETGTLFNETVEVDEKDRSVIYQIPHHNDVVESEIRYDYDTVFQDVCNYKIIVFYRLCMHAG